MKKEHLQKLAKEWNSLKGDPEKQIKFLVKNNKSVQVYLDNDFTGVSFISPKGMDWVDWEKKIVDLDLESIVPYWGNDTGVFELASYLGISLEG